MNTPVKVIATRIDKNRGNVCVSRRAVLEKSKNAEKLEVMMRKQGLSNWELVNVVPSGNNALYAIYKKPIN